MTHVPAEARIVVGLLGVAGVYAALSLSAKGRFGPLFPIGLWLSVTYLVLCTLAAVTANWLPLAESTDPSKTLHAPVLAPPDLLSRHPFGTDSQGLDVLGGIIHGLRVSLIVGVGAVAIGFMIGGLIGVAAGYYRGKVDQGVDVFTNSTLAFPPLIFLLGLAAVVQRNIENITLALAIITIPTFIRLARANTLALSQREFVVAARALGARRRRIILRDLVPGALLPLTSYAFVVVAVVIVAEASLSFLGLSIPRPTPTLGNMIAAGQDRFQTHPHLVFVPAIALFLLVLSFNRIGEEARRRWDPRDAKI
jgi:peptide/nickel transport system permease protein